MDSTERQRAHCVRCFWHEEVQFLHLVARVCFAECMPLPCCCCCLKRFTVRVCHVCRRHSETPTLMWVRWTRCLISETGTAQAARVLLCVCMCTYVIVSLFLSVLAFASVSAFCLRVTFASSLPLHQHSCACYRLNCKPFSWFLKNVYPESIVTDLTDIVAKGTIRNPHTNQCLDHGYL